MLGGDFALILLSYAFPPTTRKNRVDAPVSVYQFSLITSLLYIFSRMSNGTGTKHII
uniref:Uncharacterized protein n=1 Tax=Lepeophtheirus salmonis TaxID=72036 RepID=A0A0K2V1W9_LEPSM